MPFNTIRDLDMNGKTVLLRVDLNVPNLDGTVTDKTRIYRAKPTIDALKAKGAKIVLLSHFGRPKGEPYPPFSMEFLTPVIEECWECKVTFASDCIGDVAKTVVDAMKPGDVLLLENVRFHPSEEANDPAFVKELASLGDIYVNDAFSTAHRAHASTEGLAHALPAAAGLLMEAELNALEEALEAPKKPVMAIVGGSKISTKLSVLENIVKKSDYLVLGGAMPNTFLFAKGVNVGQSMREEDMADEARKIMALADKEGCEILLPTDSIAVHELKENADFQICNFNFFPDDRRSVDLGPETIATILQKLKACKTVLWNGPLGVFEVKPFDRGTNDVAAQVAQMTDSGDVTSVAGGGDTVAALEHAGVAEKFTYVSTAGGAFLEWLEGKTLPGVAALMKQAKAA